MSRFTTCGLASLLAFAPGALAVDGVVLINQSTITNGLPNCPTAGSGALAVICQSGSYRLSGNLTVPDINTTAIQITSDDVTLDPNGFAILGPVACNHRAVPVVCTVKGLGMGPGILSFSNNVSVSNGDITGMGSNGIVLEGTGGRIDGLRINGTLEHRALILG